MTKVRIRVLDVADDEQASLPATSRIGFRLIEGDPGYATFTKNTLSLSEALAHLCAKVGNGIELQEWGLSIHEWPERDPDAIETTADVGHVLRLKRTAAGLVVDNLHVDLYFGHIEDEPSVVDYTVTPIAELPEGIEVGTREVEVDIERL